MTLTYKTDLDISTMYHLTETRLDFTGRGIRNLETKQIMQTHFLLLWPWPWHDDFHVQIWPACPEDVLADQKLH